MPAIALIDNPGDLDRRTDRDHPGAGFPDRRHHPRPRSGIRAAYHLGRGSIVMRGKVADRDAARATARRSSSPRFPIR